MNPCRSRADLVRLWGAPDAGLLDKCAGLLGFRAEVPVPNPGSLAETVAIDESIGVEVRLAAGKAPAPQLPRAGFLRVVAAKFAKDGKAAEEVPPVKLPWADRNRGNLLAVPESPLLVPWPRLWRRLRPHMSQAVPGLDVDVPALLARLSRAETVTRLPREIRVRFAAKPHVLVDRSRRQMPFWSDQDSVRASLRRWTVRQGSQATAVFEGASPAAMLKDACVQGQDFRGALVLLLGDLGAYGGERAREDWRQAGKWLRDQGACLRALVPAPFWRVERKLALLWNAIPWEASERRALPVGEVEQQARARRLLAVVAPALRIEPGLLRAARSLLAPGETDSGTEADVLDHPAVVGRSSEALTLEPAHKKELEAEFDRLDRATQEEARDLIRRWHERLPPEIDIEERFHLSLRIPDLFDPDQRKKLRDFMCQALGAMDFVDSKQQLPPGVEAWFRDLEGRVPEALWTDPHMGEPFRRAWALVHREDESPQYPPGMTAEDLRVMARGKALTPSPWRLWQVGSELWVKTVEVVRDGAPLPGRPTLGQAEVGSPVAEIVAARPRVVVEVVGKAPGAWRLSPEAPPIPVPEGSAAIVLKTDCQELRLEAIEKPEWAKRIWRDGAGLWAEPATGEAGQRMEWIAPGRSRRPTTTAAPGRLGADGRVVAEGYWLSDTKPAWAKRSGCDSFGLWAEFEHRGVAQRMRWIPPGRFLMGSPKDEPERWQGEVQHEVELTQGYWLADTACTRELWAAVMGKNPGAFTERKPGENSRPVEGVSWDDCQEFLRRLNHQAPGLDLRLPTEAEWEYACRAGTTTPFSFGANVTPELVNYNGDYPYADGAKGEYRKQTVPVKSLPANPWGLFEMHGNVWEWCEDAWGDYAPGPATDPVNKGKAGVVRVVRGGSWYSIAWSARSAFRLRYEPGSRDDTLGFRVARGRPVQQRRQAGAEGARGDAEASGGEPTKEPRATEATPKKKAPGKKGLVDRLLGKKDRK